MKELIYKQKAIDTINALHEKPNAWLDYAADAMMTLPSVNGMTFEEIAQLLSDLFGECACDVNDNDEWLPQLCKYADTECPHPKEKNGCWMQFLMQGGADMRGEQDD